MTSPSPLLYDTCYHIYNPGVNGEDIFVEERNYDLFLRLFEKHRSPHRPLGTPLAHSQGGRGLTYLPFLFFLFCPDEGLVPPLFRGASLACASACTGDKLSPVRALVEPRLVLSFVPESLACVY